MRVFLLKLTVHEYIKIIYVNCGLKNYMKVDHCSYRRNYKPLTSAFFSQLQKLRL